MKRPSRQKEAEREEEEQEEEEGDEEGDEEGVEGMEEEDDEDEGDEDDEEEGDEDEEDDEGEDMGEISNGDVVSGGAGEPVGTKKVKGPLSLKSVEKFKKKQDRTGVVYLSRVPPYMKPEKVKHLLGRHAEIGRVFLTPEDPAVRAKRKSMGGNKRQNYVDGWVEFADKRNAKRVASELNTTQIGGKSTSFFSADMWNLRYLSKFKWHHLTEKIAYDNNVRRHKLQAEIAQAKREKDFYLERVDQNKKINGKRRKVEASDEAEEESGQMVLRTFRQAESIDYLEKAQGERKPIN